MPKYKLTYFNLKGRGELSRLVLVAAWVEFEDIRIEYDYNKRGSDQWTELKPGTPFGQLPLLEVDGTTLCQSKVIARYLAEEVGLAGDNNLERAKAAMVIDCIEDMLKPMFTMFRWTEEQKAAPRKKYIEEELPEFLEKLEKLLKSNGGGDGFFVGDKMTYADLGFFHWIDWLPGVKVNVSLNKFPKLTALTAKVTGHPKIAEWLKKRPVTTF